MTRTPQETELDRLLDLIADHIDPERRRQIDERYLRALYWEEVDRPPLVVREATDSTFKLPSPWDGFRRYPYSEAFDSPAAMLQNELIENVVPSLVLGDDGPLAVRNNHGTIQAAVLHDAPHRRLECPSHDGYTRVLVGQVQLDVV